MPLTCTTTADHLTRPLGRSIALPLPIIILIAPSVH